MSQKRTLTLLSFCAVVTLGCCKLWCPLTKQSEAVALAGLPSLPVDLIADALGEEINNPNCTEEPFLFSLTSYAPPYYLFWWHFGSSWSAGNLGELIDVNGDGLVDWVNSWEEFGGSNTRYQEIWLNTGSGFAAAFLVHSGYMATEQHRRLITSYQNAKHSDSSSPYTNQKIHSILKELQLDHYSALFEQNEIDLETFKELTSSDLKQIGITSVGALKRITKYIKSLKPVTAVGTCPQADSNKFAPPKTLVSSVIDTSARIGFDASGTTHGSLVDINGDGLPDLVYSVRDIYWDGAHTSDVTYECIYLNTGTGWRLQN
jgi:hypothetical protein